MKDYLGASESISKVWLAAKSVKDYFAMKIEYFGSGWLLQNKNKTSWTKGIKNTTIWTEVNKNKTNSKLGE